jgi:hypothetical protein
MATGESGVPSELMLLLQYFSYLLFAGTRSWKHEANKCLGISLIHKQDKIKYTNSSFITIFGIILTTVPMTVRA